MQSPKIFKRKQVHQGRFLSVYVLRIQMGKRTIEREIIERRDGVAIVPIDVNHDVLLIKEYSPGSNSYLYTLPGGQIDEGELPQVAAIRELREETGHSAAKIIPLHYAWSYPAISTRKSYTFLSYHLTLDPLDSEDKEYIEIYRMPLEEAIQHVYRDFESDMSTIGNLLMARDKLRELGW